MNREKISFRAIPVDQPIGTFFVGVMDAIDLVKVSSADVRRLTESDFDTYIGIQRRLNPKRVKDLKQYVQSVDATFPTAVILAVDKENAIWDADSGELVFVAPEGRNIADVARILDGQHRVEGLTAIYERGFQTSVSVFVGADMATQANIFATVNLAQTKVNRSLVYDLLDYEKLRSPQKSAHNIAVALDQISASPFRGRIKRLGSATEGRDKETVTQAAVVESLLPFLTGDAMSDRNDFLQNIWPKKPSEGEHRNHPFRQMFLDKMDTEITKVVVHFFQAVETRWPDSWSDLDRRGNVLPKTNGLKALMRFLKPVYLQLAGSDRHYVPSSDEFLRVVRGVQLRDDDFNITT